MEMEEVVRDLGHDAVGIADSLVTALDAVAHAPKVDVALVDVNLADGATGPEIGRRLANEHGIKVIFITANPSQLGRGVAGTIGAVEKPVGLDQMGDLIAFALARGNASPPSPPPALTLFPDAQAA